MFYIVKMTQGHYEHSYKLSEVFYNQAIHISCGYVKLDIGGMNILLVILKERQSEDPKIIYTLILTYIYHK